MLQFELHLDASAERLLVAAPSQGPSLWGVKEECDAGGGFLGGGVGPPCLVGRFSLHAQTPEFGP